MAEPPRQDMGRIAHAGYSSFSHCTASRLTGGHILTAAHCLPDVPGDEIHLGLGYDRGAYAELISAVGSDYARTPGRDVAILCDAAPGVALPVIEATPNRVDLWGYGRPYVHILNRKSCTVYATTETALRLNCSATPGSSGGPVTFGDPPQLVGIVSRASRVETWVERVTPEMIAAACAPETSAVRGTR